MALSEYLNVGLGAAGAVGGTLLNLFGGGRAARRKRRIIDEEKRKNESWFNKEYYASPLERASWQASLAGMLEGHNQRMANAKGSAAVMGASSGSVLAEKTSANQAMGQDMRAEAAKQDQSQQSERNRYDTVNQNLVNQNIGTEEGNRQSFAHAASQWSKLGAGAAGNSSTT